MDPMTIMAMVSFGMELFGASSAKEAGALEAAAKNQEAKLLGDEARSRELDRRRALNRILSTQVAQFAGSGVDPGIGSPVAIAHSSAKDAGMDYLTDTAMTKQRQRQLYIQAKSAKKSGSQAGMMGMMQAGMNLMGNS